MEPNIKLDSTEYEKLNYLGPGVVNFKSSCFFQTGKHIISYLYFCNFAVFIVRSTSTLNPSQDLS